MNTLFARAFNFALDGTVPDWVQLLPPGPDIIGADGRAWTLPDPTTLLSEFAARNKPLVVDWEHASEHRAPQGLDAPAAGWITQLEIRDGEIWGNVEWTPKAAQQIADREYRFLSPVFTYQKAGKQIIALVSAGLTNQPNLSMTALNSEARLVDDDILERLRYLLNLPTLATTEEIVAELDKLKAHITAMPVDSAGNRVTLSILMDKAMNQSTQPDLEKFIPRPDYDAALSRAANAEQKLADLTAAQLNQQIETALNSALTAGQICPATVEFYRDGCQKDGGLEAFNQFLKTAPSVLGDKSNLDGKAAAPQKPTAETLTPEQRAICSAMGLDPALYAKNLETVE